MPKAKKPSETLWTPVGRFSYPYFSSPDTGRDLSDNKYKTKFLISEGTFNEKGKALQDAVLSVASQHFSSKSIKNFRYDNSWRFVADVMSEVIDPKTKLKVSKWLPKTLWRSPFNDVINSTEESEIGCISITAKSWNGVDSPRPTIIGPRKVNGKFPELTKQEVANIKGGDWGTINVNIYPYNQGGEVYTGGGVTFNLNAVQFWKSGDAFGQGVSRLLETVEELEEEVEEVGQDEINVVVTETSSDDDIPF